MRVWFDRVGNRLSGFLESKCAKIVRSVFVCVKIAQQSRVAPEKAAQSTALIASEMD